MNKKIIYNEETGKTMVIIFEKGRKYKGVSRPCSEDIEFKSYLTGTQIAEKKALIKRSVSKQNEMKKRLGVIINEHRDILRRLALESEYEADVRKSLTDFIKIKDDLYKTLKKISK
jgi:hypothetical protein